MIFQTRHISAAALLHLLVFGMLLSGVQCTQKVPPQRIIQAVLYDPSRAEIKNREVQAERERREQRQADERRRKEEAEKRRVADEKKRQEEEARKKAEAEEAARKKAEAEAAKKKADAEAAQKKAEADAQRRKETAKKLEAERKAQLQREIAQENLRRQIEQEASARAQQSIAAQVNEWGALVQRHIQKNWIRPSTTVQDFNCGVRVILLPDGSVTSATITRSCGNAVLDKSVTDAVFRSSPIPRPSDPAAFQRELSITFVPK